MTSPRCLPVLVAMVVLACGGSSTSPRARLAGDYVLHAVNDRPLPATVQSSGQSLTFVSGSLRIDDSTYHFSSCIESAGVVSACGIGFFALDADGSWDLVNGALTFTDRSDGRTRPAIINGRTIEVDYGQPSGLRLSFTKR